MSPAGRRRANRQPELVAVLRWVEMYLFAEPDAVEPRGELLSGPMHANQHGFHRELRKQQGQPLGGYAAHIVQRHGTGLVGGRCVPACVRVRGLSRRPPSPNTSITLTTTTSSTTTSLTIILTFNTNL